MESPEKFRSPHKHFCSFAVKQHTSILHLNICRRWGPVQVSSSFERTLFTPLIHGEACELTSDGMCARAFSLEATLVSRRM